MLHDLVLKGGRVIDPSQGFDRVTDVGFENGKVMALGDGLAGADERDATGLIVTPGLIDLHTHVYWGGDITRGRGGCLCPPIRRYDDR